MENIGITINVSTAETDNHHTIDHHNPHHTGSDKIVIDHNTVVMEVIIIALILVCQAFMIANVLLYHFFSNTLR